MSRVKRGYKARRRHNRILKLAKGYRGGHSRLFRSAVEAVERALCYAYRDRRQRKRAFRRLWIVRINAASRTHGLSYSRLINGLGRRVSSWTGRYWLTWQSLTLRHLALS